MYSGKKIRNLTNINWNNFVVFIYRN
jgi:hypothetical protein